MVFNSDISSGLPALTYEIIRARMLASFLVSPIYSITITAATFILGLASEAYFFGHYVDRVTRYLRLYAIPGLFLLTS